MHTFSILLTLSITILLHLAQCHIVDERTDINLVELELDQTALKQKQKQSRFRVYWHDIPSGNPPSSIPIVKPVTKRGFGQINMIDNLLTLGPGISSKAVGKAQGFYGMASQEELGFLMAMNFFFTTGKYNGSSITILGRNAAFDHVREMPVIGGSGLFRWARGYVQARTHDLDLNSGNASVEYTIYVMHY